MKVFKDGKVYVNKNDLLILRKSQYQVPESVFAVSLPPNAPAEKHIQKNGSPSLCPDRKNLL